MPRSSTAALELESWPTYHAPTAEYDRLFKGDYYAVPKPGGVNLNKASIPKVIDAVATKIHRSIELWRSKGCSLEEGKKLEYEARRKTAQLMGTPNPAEIIFARNTTETISLAYWLAGQYKHGSYATVLMSDAENPSIYRATHVSVDNGNPDRSDPLTTYNNFNDTHSISYPPPREWLRHQSGNICVFGAYLDEEPAEIKSNIERIINECGKQPSLMIFSHVLRHNGRVMPVKELGEHAKAVKKHHYPHDPDLFICVDGAMALGNLPQFDIDDLGCDLYAISPHKTLASPPLGIARMNLASPLVREHLPIMNQLRLDHQIILDGMFDPTLGIKTNVPERINPATLLGFNATIDYMEEHKLKQGSDFAKTSHYRQQMKEYAKKQLETLREIGVPITFSADEDGSPFILSFNLYGCPEFEPAYLPGVIRPWNFQAESKVKEIATMLAEKGIALSFIRRGKLFRISFHWDTTKDNINKFIVALKEIITKGNNIVHTSTDLFGSHK